MAQVYDTEFENGLNTNPSFEDWMWTEINEHAEHGDNDLGRSIEEQKANKVQGDAGEMLVYKAFDANPDLDVTLADGKDCDLYVNGHKIEVKSRKGWDSYKDLLVRIINGVTADYYVQVIINRNPITEAPVGGWVSGFSTDEEVREADYFKKNQKRNASKIIDHDDLHEMGELVDELTKEQFETLKQPAL